MKNICAVRQNTFEDVDISIYAIRSRYLRVFPVREIIRWLNSLWGMFCTGGECLESRIPPQHLSWLLDVTLGPFSVLVSVGRVRNSPRFREAHY